MNSAEALMNIAGKLPSKRRGTALAKKLYAFAFQGVEYLSIWNSVPHARLMQGDKKQRILLLFSEFNFFRYSVSFITGLVLLQVVDLMVKSAKVTQHISKDAFSPAK